MMTGVKQLLAGNQFQTEAAIFNHFLSDLVREDGHRGRVARTVTHAFSPDKAV